ncbi:hypothetical protein DFH09DRAFT_1166230 [Mycena vulgaris]|nr:hypothetical protein DFH09DRAFT_1166230 [Mycena vulgaris]
MCPTVRDSHWPDFGDGQEDMCCAGQTGTAAVTDAVKAAFTTAVQDHIFKGTKNKPSSGRHILSVWTHDNSNSVENKRDTTTGIVEFQNGVGRNDIKTVWNDVTAADGTFKYNKEQIEELCERGYELSVRTNTKNAGTLKALQQPEPAVSTPKKGKGKSKSTPALAKLEIKSGLVNGIVVHNRFINQNVCINISSESCFPLGIGTASGKEGDSCTGDSGVQD